MYMAIEADVDLASARARLVELDLERAALRERIAVLERDAGGPDITSAVGRVALFASLFRGREDVFATRWESTRTPGKSGWAPKCSNEWAAGLWVLFSAPVSARSAGRLGLLLLTRAMRHRTISMESYDRLFPNQDTMPAGGFGNLIALPLQRARRASGCTVYLDRDLEPAEDQWACSQARSVWIVSASRNSQVRPWTTAEGSDWSRGVRSRGRRTPSRWP